MHAQMLPTDYRFNSSGRGSCDLSARSLRRLIAAAGLLVGLVASLPDVYAQAWPAKPVRIIVAAGPGGGDDFVTRLISPKLAESLNQQFVVENRPGAGGLIGQTAVLKAAPDGYTLLLAGGSMAGARYVNLQATYDVLRDFTPISLVETSQFAMIVHPSVPAKNLKEYIALARAQPGRMTFATLGAGQIPYWSAILFNNMARVQAVEVVYKNIGEPMYEVMAGRIDYFFTSLSLAVAHKARVRTLAVTSTARSNALPDIPTIAEAALPGYDMPAWRSIMGPAGLRNEIVTSLNAAIASALATPDVREKLAIAGSEGAPSSPGALRDRYADWIKRFGKIAAEAGIKPQ